MKSLRPCYVTKSLFTLSPDFFTERGIKGIILDLDDTLTEHGVKEVTQQIREYISALESCGIKTVIVSNNTKKRVSPFCDALSIPYVCNSAKPLKRGYKKALAILKLKNSEVAAIGDQIFTDVWGANRLSLYSILTTPISYGGGFTVKFKRFFERPLRKILLTEDEKERAEYESRQA